MISFPYLIYLRCLPAVLLLFLNSAAMAFNPNTAPDPDSDDPEVIALSKASSAGDLAAVQACVDHNVALDAASGPYQITALMNAASAGHLDVLNYLISRRANPDLGDSQGSTALLHACSKDQSDCAIALLNAGANPNIGSTFGRFPLMYSSGKGNDSLVSALIAHKADLNADCNNGPALYWAAIADRVSTVKLLLNLILDHHPDLEVRDEKGGTALIEACRMEKNEVAMDLVTRGAKIDATDNQGETALAYSGNLGETEMVEWLKNHGAKNTQVLIILEAQPKKPLSSAQLWALSVGAIYAQRNGMGHQALGGGDSDTYRATSMLRRDYRIMNKDDLLRVIANFREPGLYPAWNWCRDSMLVNEGYAAHLLNEEEAWDLLFPIARDVQAKFHSWQEMDDNFLAGRKTWSEVHAAQTEACARLLLNPKDPNSPWNQLPWATDLSHGTTLTGP
jgi:ankyrin repeat protein